MEAMVDRNRTVQGQPTSLLDLGYKHVGLDGGWNHCFPENHTFHWASDGRPVWNSAFPDPQGMVERAHRLGLAPGWYLNNCGCAENHFDEAMAEKVMRGSVAMLAAQGWDGVKFDSCSMFYNQTRWAQLINQTSKKPVLIENCHQGGYAPGERQWQGYTKKATSEGYDHFLGMFFGMGSATVLRQVSFLDCQENCTRAGEGCGGFTFPATTPPASGTTVLPECFVLRHASRNHMDMSNVGYCDGATSPSDCPFHMYRVSGPFCWLSTSTLLTHGWLGKGIFRPRGTQCSRTLRTSSVGSCTSTSRRSS